jgi:hypothetical protein
VSKLIELPSLTTWEAEQDLSHDAQEINLPQRIVEEMGRGVFTTKRRDLQDILDDQAAYGKMITLGLSVKDDERFCEDWFDAAIPRAQSIEEYQQFQIAFLQAQIQVYSQTWAVSILANSSQEYHPVAKAINDAVAIWYTPEEWFSATVMSSLQCSKDPREQVGFMPRASVGSV